MQHDYNILKSNLTNTNFLLINLIVDDNMEFNESLNDAETKSQTEENVNNSTSAKSSDLSNTDLTPEQCKSEGSRKKSRKSPKSLIKVYQQKEIQDEDDFIEEDVLKGDDLDEEPLFNDDDDLDANENEKSLNVFNSDYDDN